MTWRGGALALAMIAAVASAHAPTSAKASASAKATVDKSAPQAAFFLRNLDNPRDRREARADILDTPVLPGSIVKAVALVAALEDGVIDADFNHMCRRTVSSRSHRAR